MRSRFDDDVAGLARRIAGLGARQHARVFEMSQWSERMLQWAMSHDDFKTRLFHFVDVFPATKSDEDVVAHMNEYFADVEVPKPLRLGLDLAGRLPLGNQVAAGVARRNIRRMARQFIAGQSPATAAGVLHDMWRRGSAFTVDLLGEKTVTSAEAAAYEGRVENMLDVLSAEAAGWAPDDHLERDDLGSLARVNISVKTTALSPLFSPLTESEGLDEAKERLRPILRQALRLDAFVNFDAEHYEVKDLTLRLFGELLEESEFAELDTGVALQAYLKDSHFDVARLIELSSARRRPLTVRLVKGAYWDTETVVASANGWTPPVFESKKQTDANFERCTQMLHDAHGSVRAAFGSHNLRSVAAAIVAARDRGIPDHGYEIQMLYGMGEPIQAAVRQSGLRLRIYTPVGELVPGMAYLVRRLLENTSNESFLRHRFAEGQALEELIGPPQTGVLPAPACRPMPGPTDPQAPSAYEPEPVAEWRSGPVRKRFAAAIATAAGTRPIDVPALIAGREVSTARSLSSVDPANPGREIARCACCGTAEADAALKSATKAWDAWRRTGAETRAGVLFRAAHWMRVRRWEIAAAEVFEAGKPWKEADADVCEAIDFCEYYGRRMIELSEGGAAQSPPGEANKLAYQARGVGLVISPWNFPLAIPTGMVAAALVCGNAVLFKPSEQTPLVAWKLVEALRYAGLPDGVLSFLPGRGEEIGGHLVRRPEVSFIAFTGSKAVGLDILKAAAEHRPGQRHVKRVVAEMGGKNALIIDSDADADQAVPAAIYSAFGYAGQKCSAASRLIVLDSVYDTVLERLVGAAQKLIVGQPCEMGTIVGPLIDADAQKRVNDYIELGSREGTLAFCRRDLPPDGYYAAPTIVTDLDPASRVATEEIFGPVLSVFRAGSFEEAVAMANDTEYALTAGVYSRSVANVKFASHELRAGNVYINRPTTGAVVGRQPFGGYGLSGVGTKAGGPDYLYQFVDPRTVSENTLRQGFAPFRASAGREPGD